MMTVRVTIWAAAAALLTACSQPPPPRTVQEFVDNPLVLEAALVRCAQNRSETRYEAECVNAREANKLVTAREEAERRAAFEEQSERKRQALRRAQEAAAEARRRAADAQRRREEAAYLAQFGQLPPEHSEASPDPVTDNVPIAVIPEPATTPAPDTSYSEPLAAPPSDASNAPVAEKEAPGDLNEIRDELRRRNEE